MYEIWMRIMLSALVVLIVSYAATPSDRDSNGYAWCAFFGCASILAFFVALFGVIWAI